MPWTNSRQRGLQDGRHESYDGCRNHYGRHLGKRRPFLWPVLAWTKIMLVAEHNAQTDCIASACEHHHYKHFCFRNASKFKHHNWKMKWKLHATLRWARKWLAAVNDKEQQNARVAASSLNNCRVCLHASNSSEPAHGNLIGQSHSTSLNCVSGRVLRAPVLGQSCRGTWWAQDRFI